MLAPLFDKMTTDDVASRFTAREALEFLQEIDSKLTDKQRDGRSRPKGGVKLEIGERWKTLPVSFVQEWSKFARRPPSPIVKFLRWICTYDYGYKCISWIPEVWYLAFRLTVACDSSSCRLE